MTRFSACGLLLRAINMSGTTADSIGPARVWVLLTFVLLNELGIDRGNLHKLQGVPAQQLSEAYLAAVRSTGGDDARTMIDVQHLLHGPLPPPSVTAVHASVPLTKGTTDTGATVFLRSDVHNFKVIEAQVPVRVKARFSLDDARTDAVMDAYRNGAPNRDAVDILAAMAIDPVFRIPMLPGAARRPRRGEAGPAV